MAPADHLRDHGHQGLFIGLVRTGWTFFQGFSRVKMRLLFLSQQHLYLFTAVYLLIKKH